MPGLGFSAVLIPAVNPGVSQVAMPPREGGRNRSGRDCRRIGTVPLGVVTRVAFVMKAAIVSRRLLRNLQRVSADPGCFMR